MSRKISKETLKEICEQFDTLTYGSTGMKAPCICGNSEHIAREFSDDVLIDYKKTCENIIAMIEASDKTLELEKQVKALQEAFKSQATRIEVLKGILTLDPEPSTEVEAALALLQRNNLELVIDSTLKFPHVVFIYYTEDRQIKDIKWIKYADGFNVQGGDINHVDVSSQSDKAKDKPKQ